MVTDCVSIVTCPSRPCKYRMVIGRTHDDTWIPHFFLGSPGPCGVCKALSPTQFKCPGYVATFHCRFARFWQKHCRGGTVTSILSSIIWCWQNCQLSYISTCNLLSYRGRGGGRIKSSCSRLGHTDRRTEAQDTEHTQQNAQGEQGTYNHEHVRIALSPWPLPALALGRRLFKSA